MIKLKVWLIAAGIMCSMVLPGSTWAEENIAAMSSKAEAYNRADAIYNQINFGKGKPLAKDVFRRAYLGFLNLKDAGKLNENENILSICDFSLSANQKRLWVIDVTKSKILYHSLVAHGQGTGEEFAEKFSNTENSHQSSLGFYVTENTYSGDNGYSLKLHGMDIGYNDAAYKRAIVMHGADYVSESFIRDNQRLGRSWGCPAVPRPLAEGIINTVKDGSCLFIYAPHKNYLTKSVWLNRVPKNLGLDSKDIKAAYLKAHKEIADKEEQNTIKANNPAIKQLETASPAALDINKEPEPLPEKPVYGGGVRLMTGSGQ